MYQTLTINPYINPAFAARMTRERQPVLAKLPLAPINASPVPSLTSLYHDDEAGDFGDRGYPGNCGGNLIRDLLTYFKPSLVLDPMSGSGTCRDVCDHLSIPCVAWDIHQGIDACDPNGFGEGETFDFIWSHPPYWRQKLYASDSRDLSRSPTLAVRGLDSLDFHDVDATALRKALDRAFQAGLLEGMTRALTTNHEQSP